MSHGFGIQDAAVAGLGVLALAWLIRRRLRARGRGAACDNCPAVAAVERRERRLVTIGEPPRGGGPEQPGPTR